MTLRHWFPALVFALLTHVCSADEALGVAVKQGQTDQFAESTCSFSILLDKAPTTKRIRWRLTSEHRTLGTGVGELKQVAKLTDSPKPIPSPIEWSFDFVTPMVAPGALLETKLFFQIEEPHIESSCAIRLRSKNPFVHIQQTLAEAGISLFDPRGSTKHALDDLSVETTLLSSLKNIGNETVLILGEMIEWDQNVIRAVDQAMSQGKSVIALRPAASSTWPIQNYGRQGLQFAFAQLRSSRWLPKKLDSDFWGCQDDQALGWGWQCLRNECVLAPQIGPQIWQLAEYQAMGNSGGCIFVGIPLIARWHESPGPRELLANILVQSLQRKSVAVMAPPK